MLARLVALSVAFFIGMVAGAQGAETQSHTEDGGSTVDQIVSLEHGVAKYRIHGELSQSLSRYRGALRVERRINGRWEAFGPGTRAQIEQAPQPSIQFVAKLSPSERQMNGLHTGEYRLRGSTSLPSELTLRL